MRKHISIIATAIITDSIAMAGAMSSFATEDITLGAPISTNHCTEMAQFETETVSIDAVQFKADEVQAPTEAPIEAPTEAATEAPTEAPVVTTVAVAVDVPATTPINAAAEAFKNQEQAAGENALASAGLDGKTYIIVSTEWVQNANEYFWRIGVREIDNVNAPVKYFHVDEYAAYNEDGSFSGTTAAATTVQTKATTTAAAKTTAKKNSSPKTGVAFPAIPVAGLAIAAVAVAFTLKKKSN